jgi:hypothetical protein
VRAFYRWASVENLFKSKGPGWTVLDLWGTGSFLVDFRGSTIRGTGGRGSVDDDDSGGEGRDAILLLCKSGCWIQPVVE